MAVIIAALIKKSKYIRAGWQLRICINAYGWLVCQLDEMLLQQQDALESPIYKRAECVDKIACEYKHYALIN